MAKKNNIIFANFRAEMARKNITILIMAKEIKMTRNTLSSKLSGKRPINLDEALTIAKKFFPEHDVYYLFKELVEDSVA